MKDADLEDWEKEASGFYDLTDVIDLKTMAEHDHNFKFICEWIQQKFPDGSLEALPNKEVRQFKKLPPMFTSQSIFPDVVIYASGVPLLLFEVHSSSYDRTPKKLMFVLMEHLRWLRNYDSSIENWR